jgi:multimeric flavodoxin WrbA
MDRVYSLIRESDFISISSPLYFSSVPGPLKNLIDRCQVLWEEKRRGIAMKEKKGALIIAAGSDPGSNPVHAAAVIKHFFNTINCSLPEENIFVIGSTDTLPGIPLETQAELKLFAENFIP